MLLVRRQFNLIKAQQLRLGQLAQWHLIELGFSFERLIALGLFLENVLDTFVYFRNLLPFAVLHHGHVDLRRMVPDVTLVPL